MKLYDFWRSSSAWRVRIGLHHKGVEFEQISVDLFAGEHQETTFGSVNTLRQVPVLELEHQGKRIRLTQSMAILELLDHLYPFKRLFPADPVVRAQCTQLAEIINAGVQPLQNRSVMKRITSFGGDGQGFATHFISRGLAAFERTVEQTAGRFSIGDALSVADMFLVPELDVARRLDVSLEPYPTLLAIEGACVGLDAFEAAHPDVQPDAQRLSRPGPQNP